MFINKVVLDYIAPLYQLLKHNIFLTSCASCVEQKIQQYQSTDMITFFSNLFLRYEEPKIDYAELLAQACVTEHMLKYD